MANSLPKKRDMTKRLGLIRTTDKLAFVLLIALVLLFFVVQYIYTANEPRALDDSRMYLLHFSDRYLDEDSFIERIRYFFSQTNYPHTKFTGRVIALVQYWVTGTVNFKFLLMVGTTALIGFLFIAKRIMRLEYLAVIPLALILLTPSKVTFWVGPMTGYPFLLMYGLLCYYCLARQRYWLAILIAFVASFTHSPGMVIFIAALPIFLLPENRNRWIFIWIAAAIATITFYYFEVFARGSVLRVSEPRTVMNILECSGSMIVYEGKFLMLPFVGDFYGLGNVSRMQKPAGFVSLGILAMIIAILAAKWRRFDKRMAIACAFLLFCLAPGPISTLVSDNCDTLTDRVVPRYTMYALMSWCGIFIFLMSVAQKKWRVILPLIFIALFTPKYFDGFYKVQDSRSYQQYSWIQRATFNRDDTKRGLGEKKILIKAMERGLYQPSLPKYAVTTRSVTLDPAKPRDGWYDLAVNSYFCKVEFFVNRKYRDDVEVWIGSGDKLKRYIPQEVKPQRIYFTYKDDENFPLKRKDAMASVGYQFAQRVGQGCESEIRLKIGDLLSPALVEGI